MLHFLLLAIFADFGRTRLVCAGQKQNGALCEETDRTLPIGCRPTQNAGYINYIHKFEDKQTDIDGHALVRTN